MAKKGSRPKPERGPGRPPLMEYTGTCGVCGKPSCATPRRAVQVTPHKRVEVCAGCAHRWRRWRSFDRRDRRKYPELQERVLKLRDEGHAVAELARTYGLDRSLIYRWIRARSRAKG